MGQILEKKKKIAKVTGLGIGGIFTAVAAVSLGSAGIQNMKEAAAARAQAEKVKTATLASLTGSDTALLRSRGYTVNRQLSSLGSNCGSDGQTDGRGYHGAATAIAYEVTQGSQLGAVCVAHTGAGPLVSAFAVEAPPPVYQEPSYDDERSSGAAPDQETVLRTVMENDIAIARNKLDITVDGPISDNMEASTGHRCNEDARAEGRAQGWNIAVVYKGHDSQGAYGRICIDHNTSEKPQGQPSGYYYVQTGGPRHN